jgi:hypothetical protein
LSVNVGVPLTLRASLKVSWNRISAPVETLPKGCEMPAVSSVGPALETGSKKNCCEFSASAIAAGALRKPKPCRLAGSPSLIAVKFRKLSSLVGLSSSCGLACIISAATAAAAGAAAEVPKNGLSVLPGGSRKLVGPPSGAVTSGLDELVPIDENGSVSCCRYGSISDGGFETASQLAAATVSM